MHVIIDRHLITGQNDTSTLSAAQNLILLCNARSERVLFRVWVMVMAKQQELPDSWSPWTFDATIQDCKFCEIWLKNSAGCHWSAISFLNFPLWRVPFIEHCRIWPKSVIRSVSYNVTVTVSSCLVTFIYYQFKHNAYFFLFFLCRQGKTKSWKLAVTDAQQIL